MNNNNNENVLLFNTPVKNGTTKLVWNSPYQQLTAPARSDHAIVAMDNPKVSRIPLFNPPPPSHKSIPFTDDLFSETHNDFDFSENGSSGVFDLSTSGLPNATATTGAQRPCTATFTDIPVLDDLFSELNSDAPFCSEMARDLGAKSEPINMDDLERILLSTERKPAIRQPFSSILSSSYSNELLLPTGPFDDGNEISPMLWNGLLDGITSETQQQQQRQQAGIQPLINLTSEPSVSGSNIQVKIIGKRPRHEEQRIDQKTQTRKVTSSINNNNNSNNNNKYGYVNKPRVVEQIPYIPAPQHVKPAKSYRTFGKRRYVIGPEYADFVSRLQNDIPFDSSEDDEDDQFHRGHPSSSEYSSTTKNLDGDEDEDSSENDEDDVEEEEKSVKISSQELLELFEDSCSGLPGLISAFLTHRKHQIGLKGYKPRAPISKTTSSPPPLLNQTQFERVQDQLRLHFQFLIQNLALSNEIEGGEAITLVNLKLLVQLHLHLDSMCNMRNQATNNPPPKPSTSISCLNLPNPRVNPIKSHLIELIPAGIKKVAIIAGCLARPGQKQFLSLSALRTDSTLRPKTVCSSSSTSSGTGFSSSLPLKIKNFDGNHSSSAVLSNAFYNIVALFHDYIDGKLLEQTINIANLSKYFESPDFAPTRTAKFLASEDSLLLCGLHRFGCGNWESIQSQFLPFRTSRQLAIRYKNLSSRREPMNPIKDFNERLMLPLNEIEEDLLNKGVQRFGNQFHLISKHFLPHRPATVLGKLWKAMDEARRSC